MALATFKEPQKILDFILELKAESPDKVAVMTFEGLATTDLRGMVYNQPVEGLLYDLNRDGVTVLSDIESSTRWVNDYAVCRVITRLRNDYDALLAENEQLKTIIKELEK